MVETLKPMAYIAIAIFLSEGSQYTYERLSSRDV